MCLVFYVLYFTALEGVLTLMIRTKFIADKEAVVLFDMIRSNNEYVMAAYELYSYDEKLDELQVYFEIIISS